MTNWKRMGLIFSLVLGNVYAAAGLEAGNSPAQGRTPENGFGIVPMPYEVKVKE